ncbi:hypothetical protein P879_08771 [Paragonimus westermani]|uniref:Major facilitator superfamily (MFS) profile domain-containing protein n=1 Tax=Paragonimus westermani TaxID=34504 RepID=A0A8T0CYV4_9TREM|nr:hypothetical protein P879_08771 [Paragonimus westermani]
MKPASKEVVCTVDGHSVRESDWFISGELDVVRPETRPEAFVPIAPDGGWSWIVLFASLFSCLVIDGFSFSIGFVLKEIENHFNCSKSQTALLGSLFYGCYMIDGPIIAALINSYGCRAVAIGGATLSSGALLLSAFMNSIGALFITFGIVGDCIHHFYLFVIIFSYQWSSLTGAHSPG